MASLGIFKNAIEASVGNSFTEIYAAPAGKTSYIIECDVANTGNSGIQITARIYDSSAGIYAHLVMGAPVPVGSAIQIIDGQKIVLEAGDKLELKCDTTGQTVDVIVSLVEDV